MSSATSSTVPLPTVEEVTVTTTNQSEIPDLSVTMVSDKPKEEPFENTYGSLSTVNSHVSLSQLTTQPTAQPWSKGMKILLGCKVSHVHMWVWCIMCCHHHSQPWENHTTRRYNKE